MAASIHTGIEWSWRARYGQQAVDVNPWMPSYRRNLALLLAAQQDWEGCRQQCEAWLKLDSMSTEARSLLLKCQGARTEQGASKRPDNGGGTQR